MNPFPFVSFETRGSGSINGINEFWVRDVKFVRVNSYHGAIDLVKFSNFGPISASKDYIVIDFVPDMSF